MKSAKCSTHSVDVPEASNSSTGTPSDYNEHGDLVYAHMVSVCDNNCKHFIKFPISTEFGESEELYGKFQVFYCSTKG